MKLDEINETLEVNKVEFEISRAETAKVVKKVNKRFVIIRDLKIKLENNLKNEFFSSQNIELFDEINYDKTIDLLKTRSRNKKMSLKYTDSSIFYEYKNLDTFDYIRYDI